MDPESRHHCLVYRGAPSLQLPMLAKLICQKLNGNFRCLYLNSPPMVAGVKSYLAAAGVDVAREIERGSLVLSAEQSHLIEGRLFSVDKLMQDLSDALVQALADGYAGLWATGDMTWELGPEIGSGKLLEYEWRLEEFFRTHPEMGGVCQYHIDSLPGLTLQQGLSAHRSVFVNETLTVINPLYTPPERFAALPDDQRVQAFISRVSSSTVPASELPS